MRRNPIKYLAIFFLSFYLAGCALVYTDIKTPMPTLSMNTEAQGKSRVGKASCTSYVWLVSLGDCSIQAAMNNGGISKIHHADTEIQSYILGLYTRFTVVVYGE